MEQTDTDIEIILQLLQESENRPEFRRPHNWRQILGKAAQNRVLFACSKALTENKLDLPASILHLAERINSGGGVWLSKLQRSLDFVRSAFSNYGIPYTVFKTYKYLDYVTYDIDVLVSPRDFRKAETALNLLGMVDRHISKQKENIHLAGAIRVDLHKQLTWEGSIFLDQEIIWNSIRLITAYGTRFPIPGPEPELLVNMAHILYERRYVTLLDFLCIKKCALEVKDWKKVWSMPAKYKWLKSFILLASLIDKINERLFPDESHVFDKDGEQPPSAKSVRNYTVKKFDMPYFLPSFLVLESYLETALNFRHVSIYDVGYNILSRLKYLFSGKKYYPYYNYWFPQNAIMNVEYS